MILNKKQTNEIYSTTKPIATYNLCDSISIEIYKIENKSIIWKYSNEIKLRKSNLKENYDSQIISYSFRIGNSYIDIRCFTKL